MILKLFKKSIQCDGKCNNTGADSKIGNSKFNYSYNFPVYVGYMYNKLYTYKLGAATSGSKYGTGVTYNGTSYTLTNTSTTKDATHHYSCSNTTGTCSTVRYYYYNNYYIELTGGTTIEEALVEMLSAEDVNKTNSTIKTYIDNWYQSNMTNYTDYIEDTVYCNDRSISNATETGWNPNG